MAVIPGLEDEVFFGDAEQPLPDWRKSLPPDDSDGDKPDPDVWGLIGFFPDDDDDEDEEDDDFEDLKLPAVEPSPFKRKSLEQNEKLAASYSANGQLVPSDTEAGRQLAQWMTNGVPALRGVEENGALTEKEIILPPDSPVFGLALLEAIERRGWSVTDAPPG